MYIHMLTQVFVYFFLNRNYSSNHSTKVQVSHFERHMDTKVPYCHWTFPDDTIETAEPSYMMALKLNRKTRSEAKYRPVEYSFAVPGKWVAGMSGHMCFFGSFVLSPDFLSLDIF